MSVEHIVHIDMADYTLEKAIRFIGACGLETESRAVLNAPVDEGQLRQSISSRHERLTSIVSASAEHAPYQEYGTWKMRAQPFMRPAIDEVRTILRQIWGAV